ncbi:TrkA family potassium uptake protein [Rhodococcus sp. IEGM 1318]|uniref:potassium channel family protein n=1 Tax=Rhodococcus sp. IEGM 1318 TaxID=3082226 RepID=UPI002955CB6E|nr:TrkA family potassium uptake protein [Rhodococcus sp. IEGM 1318]MDV8009260.1 TrkA family potassium uptake protein [Rhodococcus sp. IEGM 1318]
MTVIGLGRFGSSLARELVLHGSEVLGIDSDPRRVQRYSESLTHTAVADTTDREALEQLGVPDFRHAVVSIGTDLESSILTTSLLADFEIPRIWAKATSRQHGRILERVGAHHVVLPEHDMGERVAHLVTGRMLDYVEFEEDYAMVKTLAPASTINQPLSDSRLRAKFGITVVAIKHQGGEFTHTTQDTIVREGDQLIVAGRTSQVERFAEMT